MSMFLTFVFLVGFGFIGAGLFAMLYPDTTEKYAPFIKDTDSFGHNMIITGAVLLAISGLLMYVNDTKTDIDKYNIANTAEDDSRCSMCGGEFKCAVCGEKGLHCEYASYGRGSDHYCSKHWGDVVEWHEEHDSK